MKLTTPTNADLQLIGSWFKDEAQMRIWSGPKFRYPFTEETFKQDLSMERLPSFCLRNTEPSLNHLLIGFGQYYLRAGRCHFGRLVINPDCRGQNKVADLMSLLAEKGCADLNVNELSLFVFNDNYKAKRVYEKLGFVETEYPEAMPMDGCVYMTKVCNV